MDVSNSGWFFKRLFKSFHASNSVAKKKETYPHRLSAVIAAKGASTKY